MPENSNLDHLDRLVSICQIYLSIYLFICLSLAHAAYLSFVLFSYPSIHPSVRPSSRPSVHPSIRPSICLTVYICIYLSLYLVYLVFLIYLVSTLT